MKSLFEQIGSTYTQVGDYLLPDVELPEEKPAMPPMPQGGMGGMM